jgi:hypothetical protein
VREALQRAPLQYVSRNAFVMLLLLRGHLLPLLLEWEECLLVGYHVDRQFRNSCLKTLLNVEVVVVFDEGRRDIHPR